VTAKWAKQATTANKTAQRYYVTSTRHNQYCLRKRWSFIIKAQQIKGGLVYGIIISQALETKFGTLSRSYGGSLATIRRHSYGGLKK
jgi:hypothetical protein